MAKLSSDGKYVVVEKGDTLSQIAVDYAGGYSKYKQLAAINNISNPNLIYVGQKIYLTKTDAPSGSTSTSSNSNKPKIDHFGEQSNADNTLFATWSWSKKNTGSYKVLWTYDTGDDVWFVGSNSTISVDSDAASASRQSTYSVPSNAKRVRFKVKPISKTYTKNNKETHYWTAEWSDTKTWTDSTPLDKPTNTPTVEIEKYKLTASLDGLGTDATHVQFEIAKDNTTVFKTSGKVSIVTSHASYSCNVDAGSEYKVRYRKRKGSNYSEWSDYSANVATIPATPKAITTIKANSETSVYLEWSKVATATSYDLEYAVKKEYFEGSDQTTTQTGITTTKYEKTGLESGQEYFFRVRAANAKGNSGWSGIKSVIIGKKPAAPTTWSSTSTAIVGDPVVLYWVHNSEDGSSQTFAQVEITAGGKTNTVSVQNSTDEEEKDKTSHYELDTSQYTAGTTITWRVKTRGVTSDFGDWSIERTIKVWTAPTLTLSVKYEDSDPVNTITKFPFYVHGTPGNVGEQTPIGYSLNIVSNEIYDTVDNVGNEITVNVGEEVYSKYFNTTADALVVELSPGNIDLQNGIEYTANCVVTMSSGLTAEADTTFTVSWQDVTYSPNAEIGIDRDTLTASIRPYCEETKVSNYKITCVGDIFNIAKPFYIGAAPGVNITSDGASLNLIYTNREQDTYFEIRHTEAIVANQDYILSFDCEGASDVYMPVMFKIGNSAVTVGGTFTLRDGRVSTTFRANADITANLLIDDDNSTYPRPAGTNIVLSRFMLVKSTITPTYTKSATELDYVWGEPVSGAKTASGEQVYFGVDGDGVATYYCPTEEKSEILNVTLAVYRREFDGSFVELATGLDGNKRTTITDPHPALDYARYRIVATDGATGTVSYFDPPGYPVEGYAAVIQWDEDWSNFETTSEDALVRPPWAGSMLKLPYNIDVSDSTKPDTALIEYIGRAHPVGYYGTQLGQSSTWNVEIEADDNETLYGLRRLARWMGDVYVREPSGSGYWANVTVSFNQTHCEVTIPVTLNVVRVEGGA